MNARNIILDILEARDDIIQQEIERVIASAPGTTRGEKLAWVWDNRPQFMERLMKGMSLLRKQDSAARINKSQWRPALRYYIRFGDLPASGYSQAYSWDPVSKTNKPYKKESGISAYPCKWNKALGKWEVELESEAMLTGFDELMYTSAEGKGRPIYLVYGEESNEVGSDLEPMLKADTLKIVKRLSVSEIYSREADYES